MKRIIIGAAIIVGIVIVGSWFYQKKFPVEAVTPIDIVVDKNITPQDELPAVPKPQESSSNLNPLQKSFLQAMLAKENKAAEFNNFEKTVYEVIETQNMGFMRHAFEVLLPSYSERMKAMVGEGDSFVNDIVWELSTMDGLGEFLCHLEDPQYVNDAMRKKSGIVTESPPEGWVGTGVKYFIIDSNNPQQKKWFFTANPWPKHLNKERGNVVKAMINEGVK